MAHTLADQIRQTAETFTRVYAAGLTASVPTRVYVLLMGDTVMGVLRTRQAAEQQVAELIEAFPPDQPYLAWEHHPGSDLWISGMRAIRISTHDVQP